MRVSIEMKKQNCDENPITLMISTLIPLPTHNKFDDNSQNIDIDFDNKITAAIMITIKISIR